MIKRIDQQEESPTQINVAINWFDELRRATAAKQRRTGSSVLVTPSCRLKR